jgi:hypothetical protein
MCQQRRAARGFNFREFCEILADRQSFYTALSVWWGGLEEKGLLCIKTLDYWLIRQFPDTKVRGNLIAKTGEGLIA